jgi:hypothetical protein
MGFFYIKDATQQSASMAERGIAIEFQPWRPIFEKCPYLREKRGGADAQKIVKTPRGVCAYPYSTSYRGFKRNGGCVLGYNIIVVPQLH